jgi:glycosyltransferase involved in cell wall biosynthesis
MTDEGVSGASYLDRRFREVPEARRGAEQSRFFARLAIQFMPPWLVHAIREEGWTICDWGCAQGDGTALIERILAPRRVTGIDISDEAIRQASARYPRLRFATLDLAAEPAPDRFDVLFSSNTIEHLNDPWLALEKASAAAARAVVVMMPANEFNRHHEHVTTFTPGNVPQVLGRDFRLVGARLLDAANMPATGWHGQQFLLTYAHSSELAGRALSLRDFAPGLAPEGGMTLGVGPRSGFSVLGRRVDTALRILRQEGAGSLLRLLGNRLLKGSANRAIWPLVAPKLRTAIERRRQAALDLVIVFSVMDFEHPIRQRPRHVAVAFEKLGCAVIYVSPCSGFDRVRGFAQVSENMFVVGALEHALELADARTIFFGMSTDNRLRPALDQRLRTAGVTIVYDYMDHISPEISLGDVPPEHVETHTRWLGDPDVFIAASARVLHEEANLYRAEGLMLVENAVDTAHYAVERSEAGLDSAMLPPIRRGRPIIGYFGALANWFDFDLVERVARLRPDYSIVLIGFDYGGALKAWQKRAAPLPENLFLVPAIPYPRLPTHAVWFDVATVPFLVNDVTLATSPLKMFEYFAMGCPVVATPLPECRKFADIVGIAADPEGFAAALDQALASRENPAHRERIRETARANDWQARLAPLLAAVRAHQEARRR